MNHCLCPMNTDGKEERSRVEWSRKPNILIRLASNGEPLLCAVKKTQHLADIGLKTQQLTDIKRLYICHEPPLLSELDMNI